MYHRDPGWHVTLTLLNCSVYTETRKVIVNKSWALFDISVLVTRTLFLYFHQFDNRLHVNSLVKSLKEGMIPVFFSGHLLSSQKINFQRHYSHQKILHITVTRQTSSCHVIFWLLISISVFIFYTFYLSDDWQVENSLKRKEREGDYPTGKCEWCCTHRVSLPFIAAATIRSIGKPSGSVENVLFNKAIRARNKHKEPQSTLTCR